ncbi:DsrE family protein [Sphingomonas lutea]|uniref:DsrE family protein n=1 Tax=Sphingomonas lutea TaxID=1045317 RepID=A0A7G9SFR1_9SPHN|nr:DsrE family protein [Sphingomonas lutea]QNN66686.1 DsrE family protein [Sphingomonas lutea]
MKSHLVLVGALAGLVSSPALADASKFSHGPVIQGFGAVAKVDADLAIPANLDHKIAYDIGSGSPGTKSKGLDGVARLINMLAANGVPMSRIHPAVVVHNAALWDVTTDAKYTQQFGTANPNTELVKQLLAKGVPIYVCGQSAAMSDVAKADLIPGVKVALSAMNAHAILDSQGYSLNPF